MYDVNEIRKDFPILSRTVNNKQLVYLDNGSSAQKPNAVIDAITKAYSEEYSNVHRGLHTLSNISTDNYEAVRGKIQNFLGAEYPEEIIFNSGATEGINMISYAWASPNLQAGDEIILSIMEHHANIIPWHFLRERQGIIIKWIETDADGALDAQAVIDAITTKTKLIAITQMSNVLGTVVDVKAICTEARKKGVAVLVDGSQSSVHMPINVSDMGCDFFVITGHKLYGPSSSGAIYIRKDRQDEMQHFMGGGDMIKIVERDFVSYNVSPFKFEAGTPGIVQMIGLGAAIDYMQSVGLKNIADHETNLRNYAVEKLSNLNWLKVYGNTSTKGAIFSFTLEGAGHPHDISTIIDQRGIAVRAGHHCAQPLMKHLGVSSTARASLAMYNTTEEIDKLVDALSFCYEILS
ncbi:MAG: cysteine desulfurase [Amylibacter sp.]|jgi:cysteine desulfurase/selenocysteine lyase|tara:strand:+ start:34592 stop:35812 length:1221 start_codon:yes stop_codon:yes gene_type:complete